MAPLVEPAPAKLNLALHVTGRRADGYHLLDSLVAFAEVGDGVALVPGPAGLTVDGPFGAVVPLADNLCSRAAALAGAEVAIRLTKRLPVAAGIGGGSADAAAVLRGLARLGHPLPPRPERLGADVPVCLTAPQPARMQGVGEVVTPLAPLPPLAVVLCNPGVPLATPAVFAALQRRDGTGLPPLPARFADGAELLSWLGRTRNDLQAPATALAPVIAEVLDALRASGAQLARMSGSGATCFGLYPRAAEAEAAAARIARPGWWVAASRLL